MDKQDQLLVGLGGSVATCLLWSAWPNSQQFKLQLYKLTDPEDPAKSPLAFLEHYHWGLASLIVGQFAGKHANLANGFGVGMIGSEFFGDHPFGVGKTEYEVKGNITTGAVLLGTLLTIMVVK